MALLDYCQMELRGIIWGIKRSNLAFFCTVSGHDPSQQIVYFYFKRKRKWTENSCQKSLKNQEVRTWRRVLRRKAIFKTVISVME